MLFSKGQSCKRIGLNDCAGFDDKTTLRCGHFLPKHGLTGHKTHVAPQLSRNGHLSAFGNSRFHMIRLSCAGPKYNTSNARAPIDTQVMDKRGGYIFAHLVVTAIHQARTEVDRPGPSGPLAPVMTTTLPSILWPMP